MYFYICECAHHVQPTIFLLVSQKLNSTDVTPWYSRLADCLNYNTSCHVKILKCTLHVAMALQNKLGYLRRKVVSVSF